MTDDFDWMNPQSIPSEANSPTYRVGSGTADESATTTDLADNPDADDDTTSDANE